MSMHHHALGSVEVVFIWRDAEGCCAILDADLIDAEERPALWIGSQSGRFRLPDEIGSTLGQDAHFCLVRCEDTHFALYLPPSARVTRSMLGVPVQVGAACERIVLAIGDALEVQLGAFVFFVRVSESVPTPCDRGRFVDRPLAHWALLAFLTHAFFVGAFFFAPPNSSALHLEPETRQRAIQVRLLRMAPPIRLRRVLGPSPPLRIPHRSLPSRDVPYLRIPSPPPRPLRVRVQIGVPTIRGPLLHGALQRAMQRHTNEMRFCYEHALMQRPEVQGLVSLTFILNVEGLVTASSVAEASGGTYPVGVCIAQAVRRWSFPSVTEPTLVTYPIVLRAHH